MGIALGQEIPADVKVPFWSPEPFAKPLDLDSERASPQYQPPSIRMDFWDGLADRSIVSTYLPAVMQGFETGRCARPDFREVSLAQMLFELSGQPELHPLLTETVASLGAELHPLLFSVGVDLLVPLQGRVPLPVAAHRSMFTALTNTRDLDQASFRLALAAALASGSSAELLQALRESMTSGVKGTTLRALTFNVWGVPKFTHQASERFEGIARALRHPEYDVVALQEMWDSRTSCIVDACRRRYPHVARDGTGLLGKSGLVTLSPHPIVKHEFMPFSDSVGVERAVRKGVLWTRHATGPNTFFDCINIHAVSPPEGVARFVTKTEATDRVRARQIAEAQPWIARRRECDIPCYVFGDCNAAEGSPTYSQFADAFELDLFRARHKHPEDGDPHKPARDGLTYDPRSNRWAAFKPYEESARLDYGWRLGRGARLAVDACLKFTDPKEQFSDHYGVEFGITEY